MKPSPASPLYQVSEITLHYQSKVKASLRPKVTSSEDAYRILHLHWDKNKLELLEEFKILLLNRANKVLGIVNISSGGIAGTVADPKLIFAAALKSSASSLILSHNHPSGNLTPSQADLQLTRKLKEAGSFLDLPVLDHIIITPDPSYYSFADEGVL
ncbi:DNA repair protein RadC [Catalinimonas alkaloidigena]|uniref:JAB domain-containing protein n=1 Tax=Catalinimonas alkaloidigena TaxID=1075417 RepID=UPI002404F2BF|nr:JAB domain-containing protein [Catalinimonas alkaloidigena]MDF9799094.1 DNA repair protein RadC [Catalinimonas alkaloidigena]